VIHSGPRKISVYDPKLSKRMRYLSGIVQKLHAGRQLDLSWRIHSPC
jgi:hypothetical protein